MQAMVRTRSVEAFWGKVKFFDNLNGSQKKVLCLSLNSKQTKTRFYSFAKYQFWLIVWGVKKKRCCWNRGKLFKFCWNSVFFSFSENFHLFFLFQKTFIFFFSNQGINKKLEDSFVASLQLPPKTIFVVATLCCFFKSTFWKERCLVAWLCLTK